MYFLSILRAFDFFCRAMDVTMLLFLPDIPRFPTGIFFHTDRTRFLPFGFRTITSVAQWLAAIFDDLVKIIVKPVLILVVVVSWGCAFPPAPYANGMFFAELFSRSNVFFPLPPFSHCLVMILYR